MKKLNAETEHSTDDSFACLAIVCVTMMMLLPADPPLSSFTLYWTWYYSAIGIAVALGFGAAVAFTVKRRVYFYAMIIPALYPPFWLGPTAVVRGGGFGDQFRFSVESWCTTTFILGAMSMLVIYCREKSRGPIKIRFSIRTLLLGCVSVAVAISKLKIVLQF